MLNTHYIQDFLKTHIKPNSTIALGTSSTAHKMIKELAIHNIISNLNLKIVPTSTDIAHLSHEFGFQLSEIKDRIDLVIEFADYANSHFDFIKVNTQSLIRDKMICHFAKKVFVFVSSEDYNTHIPRIQIVVSRFGIEMIETELSGIGLAKIRTNKREKVKTLETNYIIDLKLDKRFDFEDLDFKLKHIPGVLETGLFSNCADKLFTVHQKAKTIKQEHNRIR